MNSMAVVRADDVSKVKVALSDLLRYGHMTFAKRARKLEPAFADDILMHVMKSPLRASCAAAAVAPLVDHASIAIGRLRKIHPPAHVIIVSPRHDIYHELADCVDILPEIDMMPQPRLYQMAEAHV